MTMVISLDRTFNNHVISSLVSIGAHGIDDDTTVSSVQSTHWSHMESEESLPLKTPVNLPGLVSRRSSPKRNGSDQKTVQTNRRQCIPWQGRSRGEDFVKWVWYCECFQDISRTLIITSTVEELMCEIIKKFLRNLTVTEKNLDLEYWWCWWCVTRGLKFISVVELFNVCFSHSFSTADPHITVQWTGISVSQFIRGRKN